MPSSAVPSGVPSGDDCAHAARFNAQTAASATREAPLRVLAHRKAARLVVPTASSQYGASCPSWIGPALALIGR